MNCMKIKFDKTGWYLQSTQLRNRNNNNSNINSNINGDRNDRYVKE